ncbi:MAG: hypothetical protein WCO06_03580 [Candidatus Roizmanbacteria bacterium]
MVPIYSKDKIVFHSLLFSTIPDASDLYAVVRYDTDESILVNKVCVDVIQFLKKGHSISEVYALTDLPEEEICKLINNLLDSGFVRMINDAKVPDFYEKIHPWLLNVNRKFFKWVISRFFIVTSLLFIFSGICVMFLNQKFIPVYKDYFWSSDTFTVFLSIQVISIICLFLHECAHFITTKAVGGEARIRLSTRFIFLVAETENYYLNIVSRKQRYIVYLAGMTLDAIIIASTFWFLLISSHFHIYIGVMYKLLMVVVLIQIESIAWQFSAFLQTDLYNFLCDFFNQPNLYNNMKKYVYMKVRTIVKRASFIKFSFHHTEEMLNKDADNFNSLTKKEKSNIFLYSLIYIFGIIAVSITFFSFIFPAHFLYIVRGVTDLYIAVDNKNIVEICKASALIILVNYTNAIVLFLSVKKLFKSKKQISP